MKNGNGEPMVGMAETKHQQSKSTLGFSPPPTHTHTTIHLNITQSDVGGENGGMD